MCNKYISFKENQKLSLRKVTFNLQFIQSVYLFIFDLSRWPPSGKIRNTLSILGSLSNLRNMRKHWVNWDVCIFNYLLTGFEGSGGLLYFQQCCYFSSSAVIFL